ncbi:unnamed protein product [Urochloa humidicola]
MPSLALLAAAEAVPPLPRRHRRRPLESVTVHLSVFHSLALPTRDWAALPPELISCILHKLDPVEIMLGADKVCRSWRRAARDEPELWRRIHMQCYAELLDRNLIDLNEMAIDAVLRSQGQCQAFRVEGPELHDDLFRCLADHAPLLKSLVLHFCLGVSDQGFMQAIRSMPLLEELQLSHCSTLQHQGVFEVVAKECPRLKHLTNRHSHSMSFYFYGLGGYTSRSADGEAMEIAKMHELRSLQLIHNDLTNEGLIAILNKCPHLEMLCLRNCCNVRMTHELEAMIKRRKLLMDDHDDEHIEDFEPRNPANRECSLCHNYFKGYNERHKKHYVNDMEAMVISTVCELRTVWLYRKDLTSKRLGAILDRCPHLGSLDVWNCLNIVRDCALQAKCGWIKTKKLTTKLLTDYSKHEIFNPEGLDIHNCRNIILNNCRDKESKYNRIILRKKAKKYHQNTKKMMVKIENYIARLHLGKISYMEFDGAKFRDYKREFNPEEFHHRYGYGCTYYRERDMFERGYGYNYYSKFDEKFEPDSPIIECSTCLMFEYFAERWGVLDLDDYADYYDPSYGLDGHDEHNFTMHDVIISKRLRRYLKME